MKYIILEGNLTTLAEQVNQHMADGWHLHGSPYALNNQHHQAMVSVIHIHLPADFKFEQAAPIAKPDKKDKKDEAK